MNLYVFLSLVSLLLYLQAGYYVLFALPAKRINYLLAGLFFAFSLHAMFYAFSAIFNDIKLIQLISIVSAVGWLLYPVLIPKLLFEISGSKNFIIHRLINFVLLPASLVLLGFYWNSPSSIKIFFQQNDFWFYETNHESLWYGGQVLYLMICTAISFIIIINWRNKNISTRDRLKSEVLLVGLSLFVFIFLLRLSEPFVLINPSYSISYLQPLPVAAGLYYSMVILRPKEFSAEVVSNLISNRISEFIFYLDHNGKLYAANRFCLENLKYNTYEIQRQRLEKLFSKYYCIEEYIDQARDNIFFPEIAMDIYTKNGTPIPVTLSAVKIEDRFHTFLGMVLIGVDNRQKIKLKREVTERKRNEQILSNVRKELEVMVEKRTKELFEANERLKQEILERKRAEQQIKSDLAEKVELVQEIHHRVKNNIQIIISLINMLGNHKVMTDEGRETLREIAERVRKISSIHEDFYDSPNLSRINFSRFLKNTTEEIYRNFRKKRNIIFRLNVSDEYLGIDQAIPCGIIFYELLGNSLKHAFPPGGSGTSLAAFFTINVEFFRNDNEYTLIVSDNGVGISDDFDIQTAKSTGFQLVNVLTKQHLKGKIVVQNSFGALFILKFPI